MTNITQTLTSNIPHNEQSIIQLCVVFVVLLLTLFLLNLVINKLRKKQIHYKKIVYFS